MGLFDTSGWNLAQPTSALGLLKGSMESGKKSSGTTADEVAAGTAGARQKQAWQQVLDLYGDYVKPEIQQNWNIRQEMVPWLTALSGGGITGGKSSGNVPSSTLPGWGNLPDWMRVDVNNPYTPQELAGQQTLTDLGLSGYRSNMADVLSSSMARRGLSDSSAAITGGAGVEDAYQRARATEQAKLSQNLFTARQNARSEAAKNFYDVLGQITGESESMDWVRALSGQGGTMNQQPEIPHEHFDWGAAIAAAIPFL
jgi:hypothetical protein